MTYYICIESAHSEISAFSRRILDTEQRFAERRRIMRAQFITAEEVEQALGVSRSKAYQIIRALNKELKAMGYITIAGKCPIQYFQQKFYGIQMGPDNAVNG